MIEKIWAFSEEDAVRRSQLRSILAVLATFMALPIGAALAGETVHIFSARPHNQAAEFVGLGKWFNSAPLKISDLRGKVVLVDFWTYGCINCVRTLPQVTRLYEKYKDKGFVVIGIHTPEFPFERSATNVQAAVKRHGITYPVAQDNDYATWNAYLNRYWPAQYLVDAQGRVVFEHVGEGEYDEMDRRVATLLADRTGKPNVQLSQ